MSFSFAGGVRDSEGARGYLTVGSEVTGVDLRTGTVLWRRGRVGRPVAATPTYLITLDQDGLRYVLRVLDATTGADTRRIENFGMPDWATDAGTDPDAVVITAAEAPTGIEVSWRVRRPYRGGAPPPHQIAMEAQRETVGSVVVDPTTGRITSTTASASGPKEAGLSAPDLGPHATPSSEIIAFDRVGDRLFALKSQPRPDRSAQGALEARNAHDGSTIWEASLGETQAARPSPRRQ